MGSITHSFLERGERDKHLFSNFSADERHQLPPNPSCFDSVRAWFANSWAEVRDFSFKAVKMGQSDPRKAVFAAKLALALTLISLLIFLKEPFEDVGRYSVWAILTVVVVFEFSIGATLSKGFNRGLGTLSAGGLALGIASFSSPAGELEEPLLIVSIFIIGFVATYLKLYPTLKPYEYGVRVFLLTYCFIMVSGYRTREFIDTAVTRFVLIAVGAGVSLVINTFIYPIWAGEDLHNLVVKNFMNVADSLEGCVSRYLSCIEYERVPSKILTFEATDDPLYSGYRSAVDSQSQEQALVGFAVWEPPHGPYKMLNYPWKSYIKVSGALRHCAFMVMALHGCILSEIQAPADKRLAFHSELQRVGQEGAKVLRHLGNKVKTMEKLGSVNILQEVLEAVAQLQLKIDKKSYLLVRSESWEIGNQQHKDQELHDSQVHGNPIPELKQAADFSALTRLQSLNYPTLKKKTLSYPHGGSSLSHQVSLPLSLNSNEDRVDDKEEASKTYESASALSLATFASLLIEFVARLHNLVDSFEELCEKAKFKERSEQNQNNTRENGIERLVKVLALSFSLLSAISLRVVQPFLFLLADANSAFLASTMADLASDSSTLLGFCLFLFLFLLSSKVRHLITDGVDKLPVTELISFAVDGESIFPVLSDSSLFVVPSSRVETEKSLEASREPHRWRQIDDPALDGRSRKLEEAMMWERRFGGGDAYGGDSIWGLV
ncbi:hypothetical protein V2J09_014888 [Rumex salicifolius]